MPAAKNILHLRWFLGANLIYTLLVILWGALVRATGSGAGCGEHWPLCHGEIVVADPHITTFIEWMHRAMSGLLMVTCLLAVVLSFCWLEKGHRGRQVSCIVLFFVLIEAAIGAALVLFGLTGDNLSPARAYVMGGHLINTLLLLAAQYTHLWCLTAPYRSSSSLLQQRGWWVCIFAVLLTAASGAMVALGDTLFPASSLSEGFAATHDPQSHFLVRLRLIHPLLAVLSSLAVAFLGAHLLNQAPADAGKKLMRITKILLILVLLQLMVGLLNWLLLVPITTQLIHLGLACLLWVALWALGLERLKST